jgi:hypothetical protein
MLYQWEYQLDSEFYCNYSIKYYRLSKYITKKTFNTYNIVQSIFLDKKSYSLNYFQFR